MALSPNYGWAEPDNSSLVKNGAQDIRALGDAIDTSVWNVGYGQAGKNMVINGNMTVSQRGTSFTSNASNVNIYTTDRFQARNSALGEYTITQETDSPAGIGSSAKWLCTTADATPAASDFLIYRQIFEGQALQKLQFGSATAQTTTISFWVKSNVTGTYILNLANSGRQISASYTISSSGSWEKKSITFAGDTIGTIANTNAASVNLNFFLGAGSDRTSGTLQTTWATTVNVNAAVGQTNIGSAINNYWQITGVQWELGSKATPFQTASGNSPQAELAMCQRYYLRITPSAALGRLGVGDCYGTTTAQIGFNFPVTMRIAPTALEQNGTATDYSVRSGAASIVCSAVPTFLTGDPYQAFVTLTVAAGLVVGDAAIFRPITTGAFLGWSAEL
jgi:hypothetical protein